MSDGTEANGGDPVGFALGTKVLKGATIYRDPSDHPGCYVLRGWVNIDGVHLPLSSALIGPIDQQTFDEMREFLAKKGLVNMGRMESDDPVIVETWMQL